MWCVYIIIGVFVISGSTLAIFLRISVYQVLFHISVIFVIANMSGYYFILKQFLRFFSLSNNVWFVFLQLKNLSKYC